MFITRMIMTGLLTGVLTAAFSLIGFIGNSEAAYFVSGSPNATLQPSSTTTLVPSSTNLPVLPDNFAIQEGQNSQMLASNGQPAPAVKKKAGKEKAGKEKAGKEKAGKEKAGKEKTGKKKAGKKKAAKKNVE